MEQCFQMLYFVLGGGSLPCYVLGIEHCSDYLIRILELKPLHQPALFKIREGKNSLYNTMELDLVIVP